MSSKRIGALRRAVDEQLVAFADRDVVRAFGRRRVLPAAVESQFVLWRSHAQSLEK